MIQSLGSRAGRAGQKKHMWMSGTVRRPSVDMVVGKAGHRCLILVLVADHIAWARLRISRTLISCWSSCLLSMRVLSSALCSMMASSLHCCASRRRITCKHVNSSRTAHSPLGQPNHIG